MKSGPWTAPSGPACSTHADDLFTATHGQQALKGSFLKHSAPRHATVKSLSKVDREPWRQEQK